MENFYLKMKEPVTRGLLLLLLFFVGVSAKATDFTEVELGTDYSISFCTNWYGKWTAPSNGTLYVKESKNADYITVYSDEALTTTVAESALNGTKSLELTATSGTTYYFKTAGNNFGASVITFTFEGEGQETISLESASPEDGSTLSVTGTGKISLKFDHAVSIEGATMTSGTNTANLDVNVTNSFYAGCDFKSELYSWLKSGAVKEGDDVTIKFTGITMAEKSSALYGTDGTLTLTYKAPKCPITLDSITAPEKFKQSWTAGDTDGIVTFTFSGSVSTTDVPTAYISFGNIDKDGEGKYYKENITPVVSGNTVTLDLTGVDRSGNVATILSGLTEDEKAESYYNQWVVQLRNVKDVDGSYVYSDAQGSIGSFSKIIEADAATSSIKIVSDFSPADSTSLAEQDNIEIYIDQAAALSSYTGVKFVYEDADGATQEVVVAKADLTIVEDEDGGVTITVPVPAAVKTGSNVVVSIADLAFASGYSGSIAATYNVVEEEEAFKVTLVSPTETTMSTLAAGTIITVKPTHFDEIGYMRYAIYDAATGECIKAFAENMEKDETAKTVSYEVYGDYTLYKDHTYNLIFDAWPTEADKRKNQNHIGTDTLQIVGASEEFRFSDVTFVSVDPVEETILTSASQNKFTVTYSDAVTLDKSLTFLDGEYTGTTHAFQSIALADEATAETIDGKTYATSWVLTADDEYMQATTTILGFSIKAYDKNGLLVQGNEGAESESYTRVEYEAPIGVPDLSVSPAGTVEKIDTITVSYSGGIDMSWMVNEKKAIITDAQGNVVTNVVSTETNDAATAVTLVLASEIKTPGTYTLTIPYKYFLMGTDMYTMYNRDTTIVYTIESKATYTLAPTTVDPEDDSTVETLEAVKLTFDEDVVVNTNIAMPVIVDNLTTGETVETEVEVYSDPLDTKSVYVDFGEETPITTAGYYNVTIAKGVIGDATYGETSFVEGNANAELSYYFQVTGNGETATDNVESDPADGSTVSSLSKITLTWPDEEVVGDNTPSSTSIKLLDADGNVVTTASVELDFDVWNVAYLVLSEEITEPGTYTLSIPAESFSFGEWGETYSTAYTFTYTIEGSTGINGIAADANGKYSIFGVDGVAVKANASKADINSLKSGLYIINGKKVVKK